ncbi:hypothetical protein [Dyadobacter sandarakinus]|uniref:Glycosyl hydrolase family 98 putative carbohydrate-binding module domain-containing protein n=1 Tax=Dyadobacter sandarakinus TaxID=2747268 RepID=A0ABX7I6F6_9BACT|nr:hypothetical protein [Dyadobacter sandarakinus]QRR00768.1 hypothetical protein HWI92_07535 [Dyadobacter sandarakinus]
MKTFAHSLAFSLLLLLSLSCKKKAEPEPQPEIDNRVRIPDTGFVFGMIENSIFEITQRPSCDRDVTLNHISFRLRPATAGESPDVQACGDINPADGTMVTGSVLVADVSYYSGLVQVWVGIQKSAGKGNAAKIILYDLDGKIVDTTLVPAGTMHMPIYLKKNLSRLKEVAIIATRDVSVSDLAFY